MMTRLLLLEALSIALFAALLVYRESSDISRRTQRRVAHQDAALALQAADALTDQRPGWLGLSVKLAGESPGVAWAAITDPAGNVLYSSQSNPGKAELRPAERAQMSLARQGQPAVFNLGAGNWEGVSPIYTRQDLRGFAWVISDRKSDSEQLYSILQAIAIFAVIWILASAAMALWIARSISRPLADLHRGTRSIMDSPEHAADFPLAVSGDKEIRELIEAFNRMVASLAEQRSGLHDTLSMLDSMLANAPIGLAFFDRRCRFVRVNQGFADLTALPLIRHLGRTLPELVAQPIAQQLEEMVLRVFATEQPVRDVELTGTDAALKRRWTWLASAYPVRGDSHQVSWAGIVVLDATERKLAEDTLRKTEKLASAGRLAASIAHEINNPLEAITNLLFILRNFSGLGDVALNYVDMAELEARRIADITQQTLRFYRQSTRPARTSVGELIDSVLTLYRGRLSALEIKVERRCDPGIDLFCFAGELRQVLANLVSNAIDAAAPGTRILLRARRSRNWARPEQTGIRFAIADTGSGMDPEVRDRVFEAFFTTKDVTGTGLGLWVCQEIVVKHRGLIRMRSRTGRAGKTSGTLFQVFIPDDVHLGIEYPTPTKAVAD
jgi:signal transduction histidine kinase